VRSFRLSLNRRGSGPWLAVVTLTAAGAAAAAGYALTAPKHYRATAQLLVSPVPARDTTFTGIDVLRDTGGKRTAAASAAALVRAPLVADAVRALLGLRRSRDSLLDALDAHVVDASDVVAITVEDTSATGAAQLANAFADTLVNERTATFQSEVAAAVRRYTQQVGGMTKAEQATPAGTELTQRLVALQGLQGAPDPTLKRAGQATAPTSARGPGVLADIGLGAAAGALLGLLVAALWLAARRAGGGTGPVYDAGVSDRAAERLADRLEQRLVAREAALAARERDLQRALDDLRAAQAAAPNAATHEREAAEKLAAREAALSERVAAVTKRELEVARRAAELAVREAEPEPAAVPEATAGSDPEGLTPLAVPEATAGSDPEGLAPSAEPEAAAGSDPEGLTPLAVPEPAGGSDPEGLTPSEPEPEPAAAEAEPPRARDGTYNLMTLERLVENRRAEFPERAEEWSSYLYFLREYAAPDGSVPAGFDALIEDTFAELVA
jgi:hypothetical protein